MKYAPLISFRPIQSSEYPFLKEMLYAAIHVRQGKAPPPKSIIEQPEIAKYIANWGGQDDIAIVALNQGQLIGAVWCRLLKKEEKGYGYIDDFTPELSLAIKAIYRNQGIGSQLMQQAFKALKEKGFKQVSLSVDQDNKAVNLYNRLGFELVEKDGTAFTMKRRL